MQLVAYRDVANNLILFEYQRDLNKEGPGKFLKDYKGYLQTDVYSAYGQFGKRSDVITLCCMAHARRFFVEAEENNKGSVNVCLACSPSRKSTSKKGR